MAAGLAKVTQAASTDSDFNINTSFADFMKDIGGNASDGGGRVTFTGRDPILRSHFRIASSMAIPAMAAGVGAAAIWRERTGQTQDLAVDLRESIYNVNPILTLVQRQRAPRWDHVRMIITILIPGEAK
ncbi:MAG: hypothetical protein JO336_16930 [Acidobacteriia bacterium]|nr:hypothetical protein [Terriglobia bacterium]